MSSIMWPKYWSFSFNIILSGEYSGLISFRMTFLMSLLSRGLITSAKILLLGKTLMLEKVEGRRRRGQQRTRWLDGITDSMDMSKL